MLERPLYLYTIVPYLWELWSFAYTCTFVLPFLGPCLPLLALAHQKRNGEMLRERHTKGLAGGNLGIGGVGTRPEEV